MHQRRYRCRVLLHCSSAAVACAGALAAATVRHVAGRGARRKTDEGGRRAPTRGTTLVVLPERSGGKNHWISGRPRAGGGLERGAALTGFARQRAPRRAAERRVGKTGPGTVGWDLRAGPGGVLLGERGDCPPLFLLSIRIGSAHRMMLPEFALPVIAIKHLVALRAADVFVAGHVLHLAQVIPL